MRDARRQRILYMAINYTAIAGMELACLFALITLMGGLAGSGGFFALRLLPVYLASFGLNSYLIRLNLRGGHRLILSTLIWFFVMQLFLKFYLFPSSSLFASDHLLAIPRALGIVPDAFKPELAIFSGTILLWGFGRRLSSLKVDFGISVAEFQFGLIIMLIVFLVSSGRELKLGHSIPVAVIFVVFGLLGASVAHAESAASWLRSKRQSYWLGLLMITICLVIVLGLAIAFAITPDLLDKALSPVRWFFQMVDRASFALANFLIKRISFEELPPDVVVQTPTANQQEKVDLGEFFGWPERLRIVLRLVTGLLWLAVFVILLLHLFTWLIEVLRRRAGAGDDTRVEHLDGAFRGDLTDLIKRIWQALMKLRDCFLGKSIALSGIPGVDAVRIIYRDLLSFTKKRGLPRLSFQTPFEYLHTLEEAMPAAQGDLRLITSQYVGIRYGAFIPTEDELDALGESWQRIRKSSLKSLSKVPRR